MNDGDLLAALARAFARHPRPLVFANAGHCSECAEHNETLSAHTPESLSAVDLVNPGWDPICFATPFAYLYFFPGLARLALEGRGEEFYADQFLFHLSNRTELFNEDERQLVRHFLWRLLEKADGDPFLDDRTLWTLDDCLRKLEQSPSSPG